MTSGTMIDSDIPSSTHSTIPVVVPCPRCAELLLLEVSMRAEGPWAEFVSQKCSCVLADEEWQEVGFAAKSILDGASPELLDATPALTPDAEPQGVVAHRVIRALVVAACDSVLASPADKETTHDLLREALSAAVAYLRVYDPAFRPEPAPERETDDAEFASLAQEPERELALV